MNRYALAFGIVAVAVTHLPHLHHDASVPVPAPTPHHHHHHHAPTPAPAPAPTPVPAPERVTVVTVVDDTAGRWPSLPTVVHAWAASPYLDAHLSDHCHVRTYCVTVHADHYGPTPWAGQTWPTSDTSATTQLNLTGTPAALQSAIACHELGHALGIGHPAPDAHRPGVTGCIASTDPTLTVPVPSAADQAQAAAVATRTFGGIQGTPQRWGALWVH